MAPDPLRASAADPQHDVDLQRRVGTQARVRRSETRVEVLARHARSKTGLSSLGASFSRTPRRDLVTALIDIDLNI